MLRHQFLLARNMRVQIISREILYKMYITSHYRSSPSLVTSPHNIESINTVSIENFRLPTRILAKTMYSQQCILFCYKKPWLPVHLMISSISIVFCRWLHGIPSSTHITTIDCCTYIQIYHLLPHLHTPPVLINSGSRELTMAIRKLITHKL